MSRYTLNFIGLFQQANLNLAYWPNKLYKEGKLWPENKCSIQKLQSQANTSPSHIESGETIIFLWNTLVGSAVFEPGTPAWLARQAGALPMRHLSLCVDDDNARFSFSYLSRYLNQSEA